MDFSSSTRDPHSFALPDLPRVTDIHLNLMVDFDQRVLEGTAILTIERKPMINHIILDSLGLDIRRVTNPLDGTILHHHIGINHTCGSLVHIVLPSISGTTYDPGCKIEIEYKTTPYSFALYWLTPEQTAYGRHSFLLSNNKLIYARSWFPCQDTPSVKFTYSAVIRVRKPYTVLMSARSQGVHEGPELDVHIFRQEKKVPSYAVVIAVGSLRTKQLTERISIFAEENIFRSNNFNNFRYNMIESMLQIANNLCGPYVWGKYDICVLPPSIAHFEIECPNVTFIPSTLLGGDRSYIGYSLARNISQSWAGNLVTCENYEHLWLNKSFSLFISRKIKCRVLYEISDLYHNDIDVFLQREGLENLNSLVLEPKNVNKLRCLLPNLEYLSAPEITTKYVPYERGYFFLCHLENKLGGSTLFEPFLKSYFNNFAFRSINTIAFVNYLYQRFPNNREMLNGVDWELWFGDIFSTPIVPNLSQMSLWERNCYLFVDNWIKWDGHNVPSLVTENEKSLDDVQKMMLLNRLHYFHSMLTIHKLFYIHDRYFAVIRNEKIRFLWLLLCIKVRWAGFKVTQALNFATENCSPNYACPIFQHLYEWGEIRERAIETYNRNKRKMLNETREKIDQILHQNL
ncbi:leukotriene A-4 hydrolase-like [Temnothorax curvispinosus]|uniref:Leukotriene A-4 hydrolase-like n=1 Tax=Temnothorax curvispinosus TaxID=300111 RepID=A0A6J1QJ88_9HYME|nr:leukotriene A-4 hydrolase-like [Temnothorax curvispinosus]